MGNTDNLTTKLQLLVVIILLVIPNPSISQPPGHLEIKYERRSLFSQWQQLVRELELDPSSKEIRQEITEIRKSMLVPLSPQNMKGYRDLETHNKVFDTATFPKEGIVAKDKSPVYNILLLKSKALSKGMRVRLTGVYPFAFNGDGIYHYFFKIRSGSTEIISTEDVAIEEKVIHPAYVSPDKNAAVLKSPITYINVPESFLSQGRYKLWLKTEDGDLIFLNDYTFTMREDTSGDPGPAYKYEHPISWSPDGKYLFVECAGKVFSKKGKLVFYNKRHYTSPLWDAGHLYIRGVGRDDSVYRLNLETRELKKFMEYSEGKGLIPSEPDDTNGDCRGISKPMRFENGKFVVEFHRLNPKRTNLGDDWVEIRITVDKEGAVIRKDELIKSCSD